MSARVSIDMIASMASQLRASGTPCATPEALAFHIAETVEALWAEREAREAAEAEAKRKAAEKRIAETPARRLRRIVERFKDSSGCEICGVFFRFDHGPGSDGMLTVGVRGLNNGVIDLCDMYGKAFVPDRILAEIANAIESNPEYMAKVTAQLSAETEAARAQDQRKSKIVDGVIAALRATTGVAL